MREKQSRNERPAVANAIDAKAVEWVVRLDGHELAPADDSELQIWLDQDPRHRGAFLRAQAAWKNFDRLAILRPVSSEIRPTARGDALSRRTMLHRIAAAGGAGLALSAAAAFGIFSTGQNLIFTPLGEIRRVPLRDGSLVAVNTNSQLTIDIKADLREITLQKGEVWFDVAKDSARPFVVATGDIRVRAVGTAFSVRRHDNGADVLVTEGMVETWTIGNENDRRQVAAGSKIFVSDIAGPSEVIPASTEINRALAWRDGEIALDGETLAQAVEEFNRYNERKLTIDPSVADSRLIGWFHTNEPDNFARAASAVLGLKVTENADEIHLSPNTGVAD